MTEKDKWYEAKYPYDLASCGNCATMHGSPRNEFCKEPEHEAMRQEAREIWLGEWDSPEYIAKVLAFRQKYDRFYPQEVKG